MTFTVPTSQPAPPQGPPKYDPSNPAHVAAAMMGIMSGDNFLGGAIKQAADAATMPHVVDPVTQTTSAIPDQQQPSKQGADPTKDATLPDVPGTAQPTPPAPAPQAASGGMDQKVIDLANSQLGVKYVFGARQWGQAVDCSGFTQQLYARLGINIGPDTYSQVKQGVEVTGGIQNAKVGDLLFMVGDGGRVNGHVAVYIGGGKVIAAPHTGTVVQVQDWSHQPLTAIRRYF